MRIRNFLGYETCVHSLKRKNAPWRVTSGCENRAVLFTGRHYELPNSSICIKFFKKRERHRGRSRVFLEKENHGLCPWFQKGYAYE